MSVVVEGAGVWGRGRLILWKLGIDPVAFKLPPNT